MSNKSFENGDLISSTPPVIVKESGDKKLIYILLIMIILLFIIAIGAIFYLTTMNKGENGVAVNRTQVAKEAATSAVYENNQPNKEQMIATSAQKATNKKLSQEEIAKIVQIVMAQMAAKQNTQAKKSSSVSNAPVTTQENKELTPAEEAKQLAQEEEALEAIEPTTNTQTNKSQAAESTQNKKGAQYVGAAPEDIALIESLSQVEVDTLEEEKAPTKEQIKANAHKIKAKGKIDKTDTFNKVIVAKDTTANQNDDTDLAQLSDEINNILKEAESSAAKEDNAVLESELQERANELRYYVVKPGDTLGGIALKVYGAASMYMKIYKANPDLIKNPNKIYVGQRLRVPR